MVSILGIMVIILAGYMLFEEPKWRGYMYQNEKFAAYLKFKDGRKIQLRGTELLVGDSEETDIQIGFPQIIGEVQKKIPGLDDVHACLKLEQDGNWYIRNLSEKFPIVLRKYQERQVLYAGSKNWTMLISGDEIAFGSFTVGFERGGI